MPTCLYLIGEVHQKAETVYLLITVNPLVYINQLLIFEDLKALLGSDQGLAKDVSSIFRANLVMFDHLFAIKDLVVSMAFTPNN